MTDALLIDDDEDLRALVRLELTGAQIDLREAGTGAEGLAALADGPACVILDLGLPDMDGQEVLRQIRTRQPELPVVILTASDAVDAAVECMRAGATDYVHKPFDSTRLVTTVRNACDRGRLHRRVEQLSAQLREGHGFQAMLGRSPQLARTVRLLERAAGSDVSVLLRGESGTGKEVAARALHAEGGRRNSPFVAVNCGAIPESLIESELFGHEKGAFTGAAAARPGLFEQADGGMVFLDEIGELRTDLQVRLLRVLQERTVRRVGGTVDRPLDLVVVAATHRDLKADVAEGRFREDLYYRLAVFPVELPPLRERDGDIPLLATAFLQRFADAHDRDLRGFSPDALRALEAYPWPGNIRELENVIERAVILEDRDEISLGSLTDEIVDALDEPGATIRAGAASGGWLPTSLDDVRPLEELERALLARTLELTGDNTRETARLLGIGRATVYRKIERYGLRETPDA